MTSERPKYHPASQAARTAFYEACELAGSDIVSEENAALSIGRANLPDHAVKVLDGLPLTAREEIDYHEWLTAGVNAAIAEHERDYKAGSEWSEDEPW